MLMPNFIYFSVLSLIEDSYLDQPTINSGGHLDGAANWPVKQLCYVTSMQTLVAVTAATCFMIAKVEDESPTLIHLNSDLRLEPS